MHVIIGHLAHALPSLPPLARTYTRIRILCVRREGAGIRT